MTVTDDMLWQAVDTYDAYETEYLLKKVPDVINPKHSRSYRIFIKKIETSKLEKDRFHVESKHRPIRKAVQSMLVAAILMVLLTATAMAIPSVRDYFKNFLFTNFGIGSTVEYVDTDQRGVLFVKPTYIPNGYTLVEENGEEDIFQFLLYESADGNSIVISSTKNDDSIASFNTENRDVEEISVGEYTGFYLDAISGDRTVSWITGKYNHTISSGTDISKEELIKIAESC